ncbi:MAG: peroxiredoxin [Firmicutes bacterium]|nr:peroxiredoxin [Bacillota bacterium]
MSLVGKKAPDFTVEGVINKEFKEYKLSQFEGKWVVLFFYPLDFTFVCPTEIKQFNKLNEEFENEDAVVLGASIDSKFVHLAWLERDLGDLKFPLLADITRKISHDYGVLIDEAGHTMRATFIINPEGVVQYENIHVPAIGRSVKEILRCLKALKTGDLCPVEWEAGEATLGKA